MCISELLASCAAEQKPPVQWFGTMHLAVGWLSSVALLCILGAGGSYSSPVNHCSSLSLQSSPLCTFPVSAIMGRVVVCDWPLPLSMCSSRLKPVSFCIPLRGGQYPTVWTRPLCLPTHLSVDSGEFHFGGHAASLSGMYKQILPPKETEMYFHCAPTTIRSDLLGF